VAMLACQTASRSSFGSLEKRVKVDMAMVVIVM
jgi:hypothetical protein